MGDRSRLSTLSVYSNSIEDQIKNAMEENAGLKSYIDNMNKECLELNAALFEEANKMVTTARTKQQIAEKKLKEKNQENEMLRSQIQSLREVISKLPSPVSTASSPDWPPQKPNKTNSRKFSSSNRRNLHQSASLSSTPTLFRKSCENVSLMMSPDSESLLTTVSRNVLFDALLAEEHDADESDRLTFQAFCDWIRDDCPLNITPVNSTDDPEQALVSSKSESAEDFNVAVRSNASQRLDDDTESDQGHVTSTQNVDSSTGGSSPNSFDQFMQYLLDFDVKPCLMFRDAKLRRAIYRAISHQTLEMIPITRFTDISQPKGFREQNKYCPLLPPLEPVYQLTIEDTPQSKGDKQEHRRLIVNISCEARNRIASVVSLFQYLKMVAHKSRSAVPPKSKLSESAKISDPLVHLDHSVIEKQFARIQRLRLGIAFARLGFGIPDAE
ncbi:Glucosamine-fructose-6-phosphate aminotransferase [Fasciola gigantica]|uniref:Glucosamine-fructose-6-phosphate aminotransferase n=1 Tax=Fasciola gigantica TaxID=46835 RepID=A0A504YSM9_FASGI|nr:Glucosamine-fructose-6-phosphate aminotransferase [Fasciola gigantica]